MQKDYANENVRRKKAVEKEDEFIRKRLMNDDDTPSDDIDEQNRDTQIEEKKTERDST